VDNAVMAATVAEVLGTDLDQIAAGLAGAPPVAGRMEVVSSGSPFTVLVDYAHTPAGLDVALAAARGLVGSGRVIAVFGCGGDRDQGKRPEMGAVASRWSDIVVLTSDNPRTEDPVAIIEQVRAGIAEGVGLMVEPDRAVAIGAAIGMAEAGDVVLIAGKGHETTQVLAQGAVDFDDRAEARRALARTAADRGAGGGRP
jgi:UDP-N-acetylmuramoyl-L-alanyl-D-glutamate--2,6-diaminopimelate ligase